MHVQGKTFEPTSCPSQSNTNHLNEFFFKEMLESSVDKSIIKNKVGVYFSVPRGISLWKLHMKHQNTLASFFVIIIENHSQQMRTQDTNIVWHCDNEDSWCYTQCYIYQVDNITHGNTLCQPQGSMVELMLTHWCQSECIHNHPRNYVRACLRLHRLRNLVSLSIRGYKHCAKNVSFKQVKSYILYIVRTTY